MLIRLNERSFFTLLFLLAEASISHASTVGNITCGPDNTPGERVVCDYAIIGLKYQKLIDAQFTDGRSPDVEGDVKRTIAACADLPCVEGVIDRQMAVSIPSQTKTSVPPVSTEPPRTSSTPELTTVNIGPIETGSKKDELQVGTIASALFLFLLLVLLFWIIFRKRRPPSKSNSVATEVGWFTLLTAFLAKCAEASAAMEANKIDVNVRPYGKASSDGFNWDGQILRPFGRSSSDGWELRDGILRRYGQSIAGGFEWNGTLLKPYGGSFTDGYEWDGRVLKPYGKSIFDGYELTGNNMTPYGKSLSDGWEATGVLPIPVWACVLGLLS